MKKITNSSRNLRNFILPVAVIALLSLGFFGLLYLGDFIEIQSLTYLLSIYLTFLFLFILWSWWVISGSFFDPYILFILAAILFNGGLAILISLKVDLNIKNYSGTSSLQDILTPFSSNTIFEALLLVGIGLISFHIGALVSAVYSNKGVENPANSQESSNYSAIRRVGWTLLIISILPAIMIWKNVFEAVLTSGYTAVFTRNWATGIGATPRVLAFFLVPGSLFLLAGSRKNRVGILVSGLVILFYSFTMFFIGTRRLAIMPLIAYFWLWHTTIRPFSKKFLLISGLIALFIILPMVGASRQTIGENRLNISYFIGQLFSLDNPALSILSEMSNTIQTVAYTLVLVPSSRAFDLGLSYFYSILGVIPNLFWSVHPTSVHLLSDWLTWTINPAYALLGGGYGFSFIAEAYLNFGWIGMPIALSFIGFLYVKLIYWARNSNDPAKTTVVAIFLSSFLLFARGESALLLRDLIWYSIFPYILTKIRLKQPSVEMELEPDS